ncbi:MAG: ThiF family adenylyltransferase [Candidatus Omnitrophota bacterium]
MGRYERIIQLGWRMDILKNATFMVVGAGALGNEVLKNLALLGVGNILVIDMDKIEDHNLTRSILFRGEDIGAYKSETAARRVKEIDPSVNIHAFTGTIQDTFGLGVYRAVDVVFGCLDNIQARIDVNRNCLQTGALYIDGGLRGIDGDVKIFGPPFDVCFDCIVTPQLRDEAWKRYSCLKLKTRDNQEPTGPTSPTISSIIAGLQVQMGIKYIHNAQIPLNTRNSIFGNIDDFSQSQLSRHNQCPTHALYDMIPQDKIISLPYASSHLNLRGLLEIIKKDLGQDAVLELDYDLITRVQCKHHSISRDIFKRRGTLYVDEMECPECKKEGKTTNDAIMGENFTNSIDGSEDFLDKNIAEIGTPLLHIFKAKVFQEKGSIYKYYEISGDKEIILKNSTQKQSVS